MYHSGGYAGANDRPCHHILQVVPVVGDPGAGAQVAEPQQQQLQDQSQ